MVAGTPGTSSVIFPSLPIPQDFYQSDADATEVKSGGDAAKKTRRGRNKSEGAVKGQKQGSHRRRAGSRRESKEEATKRPSNYIVKPFMEKKFVEAADPINVQYNASNSPACSTGYVGLKGKVSKAVKALTELLGKNTKTKYRLVKWPGVYVFLRCLITSLMPFKVDTHY